MLPEPAWMLACLAAAFLVPFTGVALLHLLVVNPVLRRHRMDPRDFSFSPYDRALGTYKRIRLNEGESLLWWRVIWALHICRAFLPFVVGFVWLAGYLLDWWV